MNRNNGRQMFYRGLGGSRLIEINCRLYFRSDHGGNENKIGILKTVLTCESPMFVATCKLQLTMFRYGSIILFFVFDNYNNDRLS